MTEHKPQRNSAERTLALHIRRNRQNLRDARRGLLWQQTLGKLLEDRAAATPETLPDIITPSKWARVFPRFGFQAVPQTGWRARAKAEAAKAKAAA